MSSSITLTGSPTSSSPPPWEGENYEPRNPMESETLRHLCRQRMFRSRTQSHRNAGSPDGLEHVRDVRVHGLIKPQGEGARECRLSMLHRHFPRCSLWITGIDQPRSVAMKDRQPSLKHI